MGFFADAYNRYSALSALTNGDYWGAVKRMTPIPLIEDMSGYTQYKNTQASTQAQIDYNEYLKGGNERALQDWYKNVGGNRTIKYPELSYAGAIYRADTGSTRSMYDSDTAFANFAGNLPFRAAGLYGIGSRVSRWI